MEPDKFDTRDAWAILFTQKLMELQPTLDLADAIRICKEIFAVAAGTPPETAAATYAEAYPAEED
jgi:hypothetical protein